MNLTAAQQTDDFRLMLADHGEAIIYQQTGETDTDLTALVYERAANRIPHTRGPEPLIDKTFHVLTADLPSGYDLTAQARIIHAGVTYRPQNQTQEGITLLLECAALT